MASPPPTWPPPQGLTTPIVPRSSAILTIHAPATTIAAPASLVWSILRDTADWQAWNSFCPRVTIHAQPPSISSTDTRLYAGTSMTFDVIMDSKKPGSKTPTQLRVTDVSTPEQPSSYISQEILDAEPTYSSDLSKTYRICWTIEGGFVARGLKGERFNEILDLGNGQCEIRTWECQGGVLARAVKFYYGGVLPGKFEDWCRDLKTEAERRVKEGVKEGEDGARKVGGS